MLGYFNEETTNVIEERWLHTGDLGKIKDGDLIIYGRKKELIATSYGKMISPFKIESMLKGLEGVEEAMIVGEGKPYISALIWSNEAEKRSETVNIINQGIEKVNSNLSRAEQIRTWAILKNDLKVESKDLTPNFELRRTNICNRFTNIIESLYN